MPAKVIIREATAEDRDFLRDMFYEAVFVPEGAEKPLYSIIDDPVLQKYTYNWMLPTDMGLIAEIDGEPAGMFWARLFSARERGYGFVDEHTPEISMAVRPERRGQGIGKALMIQALKVLRDQGYSRVSLSVSKANERAVGLYRSMAFATVAENREDYVMVKKLV
ncbi:MAG: GNAT family N-acetyltransferase [Bacillota bacterium]|nr:GNAT family N-acetyltransferase [Bacillota bacterium]MDW7677116.1 GNAT family N-acetyltransferase [Bacillota bacterium]